MCDKAEVSESSGAFSGRKSQLRAAVGNLKPVLSYHPSTESSSIGRYQLYVKETSHATSITNKVSNTVAQLKRVPLIRSPHHTPVPSSPLRHFLAALDIDPNRSPFRVIAEWQRIVARLGGNEPNEVDVCLSLRDIPQ
jgi:hypothetical protein